MGKKRLTDELSLSVKFPCLTTSPISVSQHVDILH